MRCAGALCLVVFISCSISAADDARDWTRHPAIVEVSGVPKDLYAVGDVLGDYDRVASLLVAAKLIKSLPTKADDAEWDGGPAVLVCTGNLISGHNQSLQVIALFRALQTSAEKSGGKVIVTLGNFEAQFLASNGARPAGFAAELKAANIAAAELAAGVDSAGIGQWLRGLPVAAKVGDWFFCHAGNTQDRSLSDLKSELEKQISAHGYGAPILTDPKWLLESKPVPRPWWEIDLDSKITALENREQADANRMQHDKTVRNSSKDYNAAHQDQQAAQKQEQTIRKEMLGESKLRAEVKALQSDHFVLGHYDGRINFADNTYRAAGTIATEFKGLVYFIDSGMTRTGGTGHVAMLHVESGHHSVVVTPEGDGNVLVP